MMRGSFSALAICGVVSILLSACAPPPKVSTSLIGTAAHTGTLTILRVDDGWRGDAATRTPYRLGDGIGSRTPRFVPVRGKNDVAVFDTPDRRVTNDDFVTVTLNSAFIKYFREGGIIGSATGEIAMVVSFSAGSTVKENFLVVSSRGQTFGSFLDVQDWPAIGPVKIDGDSLTMRIVIIELDQVDNESMKQFIKATAGFVGTVLPQAGAALKIAQGVADFVISQNGDDVVFDQRFGFQRMDEGRVVTRMPLLFGKYVLVMQEDALAGTGAARNAPSAAMQVPAPDDMRYDLHFDRLYKVYPYRPDVKPADCPDVTSTAVSVGMGMDMGKGTIEWPQFFPAPGDLTNELTSLYWGAPAYKDCVLKEHVNSTDAQNLRRIAVGFEQPYLGDLELFGDLDRTLKVAYLESVRTVSSQYEKFPDTGSVTFNYPIVQYPEAAVFLGQYPLHTHLVLSIDRSLGGEGPAFHDRFEDFSAFLEREMKTVRDNNRFDQLSALVSAAVRDGKNQKAHIRRAAALRKTDGETDDAFKLRKICYLWNNTLAASPAGGDQPDFLSDAAVFNEIYHLSGFKFESTESVATYMRDEGQACPPPT